MKLTVLIPAHNEATCIQSTIRRVLQALESARIPHEVLVINDNSTDHTERLLQEMVAAHPGVRYVNNEPPHGYGFAVRKGLRHFTGDAVAIFMADASDDPQDLVRFYLKKLEGYDCVFGSRWVPGGRVYQYPWPKWILNRLGNRFIQLIMQVGYDDMTNAFKLFDRRVIDGCEPILSYHFNLTVELPLKAIVRGYTYAVVPNSWTNRKTGMSKWNIREMGSRYLFIVLYCLIEKWLSRRDYHSSSRRTESPAKSGLPP